MEVKKQKEYWESVSQKKNFTTPFQADEFEKNVKKDGFVLDIGCGYGRTLNELHQLGYSNLLGMDFSQGMVERGHRTYPYLNLKVMQEGKIDMADSSVDAVILFAVLTCISNNAEQLKLVREIHRVLKPGGVIYVNDFLLNQDQRNLDRYDKYQERYGTYGVFELPEGAVLRHHDESWIRELLSDFQEISFRHLTFTTMNGHTSNGFYFLGRSNKC